MRQIGRGSSPGILSVEGISNVKDTGHLHNSSKEKQTSPRSLCFPGGFHEVDSSCNILDRNPGVLLPYIPKFQPLDGSPQYIYLKKKFI